MATTAFDSPARNTRAQARKRVASADRAVAPLPDPQPRVATRDVKSPVPELNPRTHSYEFAGPIGATILSVTMPMIVLGLNVLCTPDGCPAASWVSSTTALVAHLQPRVAWSALFDPGALVAYLGWFAWCVAMYRLLPGDMVRGTPLRNGQTLLYKINGFNTLVFTAVCLLLVVNFHGPDLLLYIADNFVSIIFSAILFTYAMSLGLYLASFKGTKLLALGGNSGNPIYDFFIGRELNPRIGNFDLKQFCELRPGLIGWLLLDVAFLTKQYVTAGYVTDAMALVVMFQGIYVIDALYNESKVLTTMDITTDGFGYMLVAGDLLWVPFTYTLQARYLSQMPATNLGWLGVFGVLALNALGYYIFRSANSEKDAFRSDPTGPRVKHLQYMETAAGSKLLISGWWGRARHINYFGDWLMSVAWSLPCGFTHPIPYFYPVYFAVLLVHRFYRDEHKCKTKYGKDWDKYCALVPYRIVPYVW
ncbi:hypothetical protein AMAG_00129 [Allomyces macrogynus ATCC 38327]|uniref:Delta(14)-sterol reductase ERG24 n=1 Tax=Allomyces macrogynus (strain ATCC 38327) TaxID=578462 RepID=A0A0L0RUQ3_ALLM3|nr:hypothetical protein AMAG_00129 [Allomyces macrogynus ATCC 38327]|eukprot:KNE54127.1 hypothetical protein AMAG_00129 [Allomyces macrogynus ATCC 38327]